MLLLTLLLVSRTLASPLTEDGLVEDESRLLNLDHNLNTNTEEREITYKSAGDYTLISVPWSGATSLNFNDSTAATLSTIGNAALLVGGLYLLSGFPTAIARSDPFGISRRFGRPAPPPKFYKPHHHNQEPVLKKKSGSRQPRPRPIERRGPAERFPEAEERTLPQLPQLPSMFERRPAARPVSRKAVKKTADDRQLGVRAPQFPGLRPLQFRMPQLPQLRLPSLPGLRRPAPRPLRPRPQPAPAPEPQQSAPVSRPASPAPSSVTPRPAPVRAQQSRPRPQSAPVIPPVAPVAPVQAQPDPRPAAQADFGSAFSSDPFSEFQNADFGNEESFRDLIAAQFGDSFDLKRLPEN